ncbi:MAG: hypothetical protein R3F19_21425 [Verrucomicrobiales bacterium]
MKTSRVLYGGRLFDIADATPDRIYDGIYTGRFIEEHPNWGITNTFRVPWMDGEHFEEGYLHGADAGTLALAGSSMALDGILRGLAVSGPRQQETPATGGALDLNFEVQQLGPGTAVDPFISPTPPSIAFGHSTQSAAAPFSVDESGAPSPLRDDRVARVILDPDILSQDGGGFASLKLRNPDGNITVPSGIALEAPVNGSITFEAANISIHGDVIAPGGNLSFATYNISPSIAEALSLIANPPLPDPNPGRGQFVLGRGASLDTSGLVIDQRYADSPTIHAPLVTDGGNVSIRTYSANLAAGSLIDVSGGALANPRGAISYGKAGSIEIITGQDLNLAAVDGGALHLGSELRGFSGTSQGGTLSLQAQLIQIGGGRLHPLSLVLDPDFFSQGGFSTFNLTGIGADAPDGSDQDYLPAVSLAAGAKVRPAALGWLGIPWTAPDGELELVPFLRPEGLRAPVSIALNGSGLRNDLASGAIVYRGDVLLGAGSEIRTDALGSIRVAGETISAYGSLIAPGGTIALSGGRSDVFEGSQLSAKTTVYLAPSAWLSTAGTVLTQTDGFGRRIGSVLPGGSISVSGNIVAERGAVLDASGISGSLDVHPVALGRDALGNALAPGDRLVPFASGLTMPLYQGLSRPTTLDSAGGSIRLNGSEMLFTDATLLGHSGGPTAAGGALSVSSGRFRVAGSDFDTAESNLIVTQSGTNIPVPFAGSGTRPIGQPVMDAEGNIIPGMGYFAANTFARGGFSSLSLGGNVEFQGPVTISADNALRVATGGVIRADSPVNLFAHYAALGQSFMEPQLPGATVQLFTKTVNGVLSTFSFPPTAGPGSLSVVADHIDIGTLSLQGIGETSLVARRGDIRGNGTLQVAGSLGLNAAQIYPTTGSAFNIVAYDSAAPGSITITGSGTADVPLSGGGSLNLFASEIVQGGTLRAPFGSIQLGWDGIGTAPFVNPVSGTSVGLPVTRMLTLTEGSQTSVAAVDPRTGQGTLIPYGYVRDGQSWIAPNGEDITAVGPPEKRIALGGQTVVTADGSLVDVRGGGELFGYQFIPGTGGSTDVLASSSSFAIIPGYDPDFSPYAPFNRAADTFGGDTGYRNDSITVGDQIYLSANHGLPAGNYTLLPARYALLPGAWLVSPQSGAPVGSFASPDGSFIVSGYRHNAVDPGTGSAIQKRWELAPGSVVRERSMYEEFGGDLFFAAAAESLNIDVARLPMDSGRVILQATLGLDQRGTILGSALGSGRGALVDISSPLDIVIGEAGATVPDGSLLLTVDQLNTIGAESLLVGGIRTLGTSGTGITINTGRLTLDNAQTALTGNDVVLVAKNALTLMDRAQLLATGATTAETLLFGAATVDGSGNGLWCGRLEIPTQRQPGEA